METKQFIEFKAKLELLKIPDLIHAGSLLFENEGGRQEKEQDINRTIMMQKSDMFWLVLERKIRNTLMRKGQWNRDIVRSHLSSISEKSPSFGGLIQIKTPKVPPFSVLRTLVDMCQSTKDYARLIETYPDCLTLKLQNGDLLLHRVISQGGYKERDLINSIICDTMKLTSSNDMMVEVNDDLKFGGLPLKNDKERSPLIMLFGLAATSHQRSRWTWLTSLIQRIAHIQLHYCDKKEEERSDFDKTIFSNECYSSELAKTPLLHAALEMSCPFGLINRILDSCRSLDDICQRDSFGRTPLVVALSQKETPAEVVIKLFRRTPVKALQLLNIEKEGDLPLHRILKAGIKYHSRHENELLLIGTFVEQFPSSLGVVDDINGMPPFMLASIDNVWSLDVCYGLLRTSPGALEPYMQTK